MKSLYGKTWLLHEDSFVNLITNFNFDKIVDQFVELTFRRMKNVMKTIFGKVVILEGVLKAMLCKNFVLKSLDYMRVESKY